MKKPQIPALLLALLLCGCGSGQNEELQGRPLVLQLGVKISTATTPQTLDEVLAKLPGTKLGPKVQEHLTKAVEAQRKLLGNAAEMQMNERVEGARKVVTELEAASAAVE